MDTLTMSPWGFSSIESVIDKLEVLPTSTSTPSCSGTSYGNAFLLRSHSYGDEREQNGAVILTELERLGVDVIEKSAVLVFLTQNQFPVEIVREGFEFIRDEFPSEKLQLSIYFDPDSLRETLYFSINVTNEDIDSSVKKVISANRKWLDGKPSNYSNALSIDLRVV